MIKSTYISNIEIASFDNQVTDIVNALYKNENGKVMNIGIKNQNGEIYRILDVEGFSNFMSTISKLISLGLKDELVNSIFPLNGLDAIFSK
ncbi:hypothetical protein [Vibrio metschnikovii]|uniref:Uncharacterized protein n=1 Tax=Vibrio metschnikovii TaxID=28172 RepID=A0A9X0RE50_VIBME|nr:hypothetical protein [Vibrio metschnikovii]MBC5853226.1 hypothetical protein [Vibrio metschnikovii]